MGIFSITMGYKADNSHYWRGKVQMELKKYSQAVADFDRVIAKGSSYPGNYHARCLANHYAGNYAAAQADALKAAELYLAEGKQEQHQEMIAFANQARYPY